MQRPQVHFSCVQINEFPLVVGDNPACHNGPAIELSWDRLRCTVVDIDAYEVTRRTRRVGKNLILSQSERRKLLKYHHVLTTDETQKQQKRKRNLSLSPKQGRPDSSRREESSLRATMDDIEKRTTQLAQKLHDLGALPLHQRSF
jgi:hypothetical protein